jgi:peptide/nickel transport system substrate-binding protein
MMCVRRVPCYLLSVLCYLFIVLAGCDYFSPEPWPDFNIFDPSLTAASPAPPPALPTGRPFRDLFTLPWTPPATLHPLTDALPLNRSVYTLVYEGLFAMDEHFEPQPVLADSIYLDGTRAVVTLRSGVLFHNGEQFTARDAEASLRMAMRRGSPYAAQLSGLLSVRATGDFTLEISLAAPNPRIAALLDVPVVPAAWSGSAPHAGLGVMPPGTGPYRFAGEEDIPHLTACPNWRSAPVPLGRLELAPAADARDLIGLFDTGGVNFVDVLPGRTGAPWFHADSETWGYATSTLVYLGVNTARAPLHWPEAREALSAAMDRGAWARTVYAGHADPALTVFPPSSRLSDTAFTGYDPFRFLELLGGLGIADTGGTGFLDYPSGRARHPLSLRLLVSAENHWRVALCRAIAAHMRPLGVDVTVDVRRWDDFTAAVLGGDYDLFLGEITLGADLCPVPLLATVGYTDERLTGLLERWPGMPPDMLPFLAAEINDLLAAEAPVIPLLFTRGTVRTTRGTVSGVRPLAGRPFDNIAQWIVR